MQINKADKGASGRWRRLQFHLRRAQGHLLRYAWNRVRWHVYPRLRLAGTYPDHVDLELSAACNMKCPMCYTVTDEFLERVPRTNMDFALFRKVVDELAGSGVYSIRLSWRGEPTLNRHFMDCVRYATAAGIKEIDSLTNALRLTPEMFEELVDLRMAWLTISFDGTGATYERIRKPAKYDEMVAKIRTFAEIKRRKRSAKPVVRLQGVWPAIQEDPGTYFDTFTPIVDEIAVNSLLDYLHEDTAIEYLPGFTCPVPFQRLAVSSEGMVFMCLNDEMGRVPIGDVRRQTIREIWNSPGMRRVREVQRRGEGTKTYQPCRDCYQPRRTAAMPITFGNRTITLDQLVGGPQAIRK